MLTVLEVAARAGLALDNARVFAEQRELAEELRLDPATPRTETVTTLHRGDTVLLYTDGLVERRGEPFDDGLSRLTSTLAELGAGGLPVGPAV